MGFWSTNFPIMQIIHNVNLFNHNLLNMLQNFTELMTDFTDLCLNKQGSQ